MTFRGTGIQWPDGHKSHACGTDIDVGITGTKGGRIVATDLARLYRQALSGGICV